MEPKVRHSTWCLGCQANRLKGKSECFKSSVVNLIPPNGKASCWLKSVQAPKYAHYIIFLTLVLKSKKSSIA